MMASRQEAEQVDNKEPTWQQAEEASVSNQQVEEIVQEKESMQENKITQEQEMGQEQGPEESSPQQEFDLLGDMAATITTE